jgi:hypothetical protein
MVAARDAWRAKAANACVLAEVTRYGGGASLTACPALLGLFAEDDNAQRWIAELVGALCASLAGEAFGQPPFRHGYDRGSSTLLLARSGRAHLVLHASEPSCRGFETVSFADADRREAVLAGEARGQIVTRHGSHARFDKRRVTLEAGAQFALDLRKEALQVLAIDRRLVSLRLHRIAASPGPTREYHLSSGALLRQAAGDIRTSRLEVRLALLGRMGRPEAAPAIAAIAREPGDPSLRWQALRECLALDTAQGLATLDAIARAANDPLAEPASALRAELLDTYPELAALAESSCHA